MLLSEAIENHRQAWRELFKQCHKVLMTWVVKHLLVWFPDAYQATYHAGVDYGKQEGYFDGYQDGFIQGQITKTHTHTAV